MNICFLIIQHQFYLDGSIVSNSSWFMKHHSFVSSYCNQGSFYLPIFSPYPVHKTYSSFPIHYIFFIFFSIRAIGTYLYSLQFPYSYVSVLFIFFYQGSWYLPLFPGLHVASHFFFTSTVSIKKSVIRVWQLFFYYIFIPLPTIEEMRGPHTQFLGFK